MMWSYKLQHSSPVSRTTFWRMCKSSMLQPGYWYLVYYHSCVTMPGPVTRSCMLMKNSFNFVRRVLTRYSFELGGVFAICHSNGEHDMGLHAHDTERSQICSKWFAQMSKHLLSSRVSLYVQKGFINQVSYLGAWKGGGGRNHRIE